MDIQITRTVSETGTGRQFDTTQTHLTDSVVDKTQSFSSVSFCCFFCLFVIEHIGPFLVSADLFAERYHIFLGFP